MTDSPEKISSKIALSLQTTLDLTRLIEIFSAEVGALIVHQGIRYSFDDFELDLKVGQQARHACSYHLNIGDEPLGKLTFRRNQKFTDAEIEVLEQLLTTLLYPLRNALLYEDALELSSKDQLTGICNRSTLDLMLKHELSHTQRQGSTFTLLIMDIDHFKSVNDNHGHIVGDCALKAVANMFSTRKRNGDFLFRYGGEEFVIIMHDVDQDEARQQAEYIRSYIESHPCICAETQLNITISIGGSISMEHEAPETLLSRADQALYRAKNNGRNRVCFTA